MWIRGGAGAICVGGISIGCTVGTGGAFGNSSERGSTLPGTRCDLAIIGTTFLPCCQGFDALAVGALLDVVMLC